MSEEQWIEIIKLIAVALPGIGALIWQILVSVKGTEHKRGRIAAQLRDEEEAMQTYYEALLASFMRFQLINGDFHRAWHDVPGEWDQAAYVAQVHAISEDASKVMIHATRLPLRLREVARAIDQTLDRMHKLILEESQQLGASLQERQQIMSQVGFDSDAATLAQADARLGECKQGYELRRIKRLAEVDRLKKWIVKTWEAARGVPHRGVRRTGTRNQGAPCSATDRVRVTDSA